MKQYEILSEGLKRWDIDIKTSQIEQFKTLTNIMLEYNEKVNLTRITKVDEVIKLHYLDSLSVLNALDIPKNAKVIDVGTGAGFPGLPLKIIREDLDITLLDSLNKRIDYLKMAIEKLGLSKISAVHARSEELAQDITHREKYDVVVSRAVASLPKLCEFCMAFVKLDGYFVAYKGKEPQNEAEFSENAIETLGGQLLEIKEISIYKSDTQHNLVIIKKIKSTPKEYPRKNAVILKKPL